MCRVSSVVVKLGPEYDWLQAQHFRQEPEGFVDFMPMALVREAGLLHWGSGERRIEVEIERLFLCDQ